MRKPTISDIRKTRVGRPPVYSVPVMVRIPPAEVEPIDRWIQAQAKPKPSRPEAIRRLVEIGLLAGSSSPDLRNQAKASESATKARKLAGELG